MSNYTPSTNFATKDALSPGDPLKIVRGTEINTEFTNIAVAVATKLDTTGLASPGPIGATTPSSINGTTGTFSGDVQMASTNGGQLAGLRNKIINGDMRVCQRATSTALVTGSNQVFFVDRFRTGGQLTGAFFTTSQSTDVPNNNIANSARLTVTTPDAVIVAADVLAIVQPIEGFNIKDLFGNTFTLSFWVRSSKTGIHCVAFSNGAADRSYVVEYTIGVANIWEYKTITVNGGLTSAGTWDVTSGTGLSLRFTLMAGSNSQTTAGAWNTGNFFATANQVNCLDVLGNIFAITAVQLEIGPVATPFEQRPIGMELALCQRYYYRLTPGAVSKTFSTAPCILISSTSAIGSTQFPVPMRTTPTILDQSGTANQYSVNSVSTFTTCTFVPVLSVNLTTQDFGGVQFTTAGATAGVGTLRTDTTNGATAFLGWSAEL